MSPFHEFRCATLSPLRQVPELVLLSFKREPAAIPNARGNIIFGNFG
jgi:hypothetical protein